MTLVERLEKATGEIGMRKMLINEVRGWGSLACAMACILALHATGDDSGWYLALDLVGMIGWMLIGFRFARLKTIVTHKGNSLIIECHDVVLHDSLTVVSARQHGEG